MGSAYCVGGSITPRTPRTLVKPRLPQQKLEAIRMVGSVVASGPERDSPSAPPSNGSACRTTHFLSRETCLHGQICAHSIILDCVLSAGLDDLRDLAPLARGSNPRLRMLQLRNDNLENGTVSVLARAEFAEVSEGKDEEVDDLANLLDKVSLIPMGILGRIGRNHGSLW